MTRRSVEINEYTDLVRELENLEYAARNYSIRSNPWPNVAGVLIAAINMGYSVEDTQEMLDSMCESLRRKIADFKAA